MRRTEASPSLSPTQEPPRRKRDVGATKTISDSTNEILTPGPMQPQGSLILTVLAVVVPRRAGRAGTLPIEYQMLVFNFLARIIVVQTNSLKSVQRRRRTEGRRLQLYSGIYPAGVREAMTKETFEQFAVPDEVRAFVEQSVAQSRTAFDGIFQAANRAIMQFEGNVQAARNGDSEIADKSMAYAEKNMKAMFEFAQKLMQARHPADVMQLQSEFLSRQMQTHSTQVQELGKSAVKIVIDIAKL